MKNTVARFAVLLVLFCAAVLLQACGRRSPEPTSASPDHIRGTIESVNGQTLTVATAAGAVRVQVAQPTQVGIVVRSDREHIKEGSFLGITSVTQPDGSQRAVEVHVFPEAMRGTGEGSYGWDLPGTAASNTDRKAAAPSRMTNGTVSASRMTNGTVSSSRMTNGTVTTQGGGAALTLEYKSGTSGGSQTITVPPDIPIVAIEPGQPTDLQPGAHVFVIAHRNAGDMLTADRILAGRNGVTPPM